MGSKIAEVRVRTSVVYIAACSVAIPLMFLLLAVADALQPGRQDFHLLDIAIALILFVPLGAVHELLHGLAAVVHGGLHPQDLRIRVVWKAGALACHIKVPISVRTARIVALTPFAVTVPLVLGLLLWHPSTVVAVLLHFTIFGCSMDLLMVYHLRRFGNDLLVVDHPSEPAFDIYTAENSAHAKGAAGPSPTAP